MTTATTAILPEVGKREAQFSFYCVSFQQVPRFRNPTNGLHFPTGTPKISQFFLILCEKALARAEQFMQQRWDLEAQERQRRLELEERERARQNEDRER